MLAVVSARHTTCCALAGLIAWLAACAGPVPQRPCNADGECDPRERCEDGECVASSTPDPGPLDHPLVPDADAGLGLDHPPDADAGLGLGHPPDADAGFDAAPDAGFDPGVEFDPDAGL